MRQYRIDHCTEIYAPPAEQPADEGFHGVGVAQGIPRGYWLIETMGTDCNGDDEPVDMVITSGHFVTSHGDVRNLGVSDVRRIYVRLDYTAEETADLVLSALSRLGVNVNPDAREYLMSAMGRMVDRIRVSCKQSD